MAAGVVEADQGFAPILGEQPRVLILGTLPSQRSLRERQYYGHPQNAFWWIMSRLLNFDPSLDYSARTRLLTQHHIAVWDVIASCIRPGSMDADIDAASVRPNDFSVFFQKTPSLKAIAFNGKAAQGLFRKHAGADWPVDLLLLPSTSPAYASITKDAKLEAWLGLRDYL